MLPLCILPQKCIVYYEISFKKADNEVQMGGPDYIDMFSRLVWFNGITNCVLLQDVNHTLNKYQT